MDAYKDAGVDISAQDNALSRISQLLKQTANEHVLTDLGAFGAVFEFPVGRVKNPVLIASCDGVGTKIRVAIEAGSLEVVGSDLVNHCVNDVLVQGAIHPLFFLDYFASGKLQPDQMVSVVTGMTAACRENGLALIGGETAEMPGFYREGMFDLVGTIVAMADREKILTGKTIREGDIVIGLPSAGLHTNGYSLARHILFDTLKMSVHDPIKDLGCSVAEALLKPHLSYLQPLKVPVRSGWIKGMAHITGGGMTDNIPRILPESTGCVIQVGSWVIPELFYFLQKKGKVSTEEMFQVFNMGIGMVVIVGQKNISVISEHFRKIDQPFNIIGSIQSGEKDVLYNVSG